MILGTQSYPWLCGDMILCVNNCVCACSSLNHKIHPQHLWQILHLEQGIQPILWWQKWSDWIWDLFFLQFCLFLFCCVMAIVVVGVLLFWLVTVLTRMTRITWCSMVFHQGLSTLLQKLQNHRGPSYLVVDCHVLRVLCEGIADLYTVGIVVTLALTCGQPESIQHPSLCLLCPIWYLPWQQSIGILHPNWFWESVNLIPSHHISYLKAVTLTF